MISVIYVDDLLLSENNMEVISWMKLELAKTFEMKYLNEDRVGLSLEMERYRAKRKVSLKHSKYASSALVKFSIDSCHPVNLLTEDCKRVKSNDCSSTVLVNEGTLSPCTYVESIVSLMYLITGT